MHYQGTSTSHSEHNTFETQDAPSAKALLPFPAQGTALAGVADELEEVEDLGGMPSQTNSTRPNASHA